VGALGLAGEAADRAGAAGNRAREWLGFDRERLCLFTAQDHADRGVVDTEVG
jgi:hypothetical protein